MGGILCHFERQNGEKRRGISISPYPFETPSFLVLLTPKGHIAERSAQIFKHRLILVSYTTKKPSKFLEGFSFFKN